MALPLCILVSVGGRRSQRPGPSPTLGPSHQRQHKSRVSLRGPPCANGILCTPQGEVRDIMSSGSIHEEVTCLELQPLNIIRVVLIHSVFTTYTSPLFVTATALHSKVTSFIGQQGSHFKYSRTYWTKEI